MGEAPIKHPRQIACTTVASLLACGRCADCRFMVHFDCSKSVQFAMGSCTMDPFAVYFDIMVVGGLKFEIHQQLVCFLEIISTSV